MRELSKIKDSYVDNLHGKMKENTEHTRKKENENEKNEIRVMLQNKYRWCCKEFKRQVILYFTETVSSTHFQR